jgi:hypothetical protein
MTPVLVLRSGLVHGFTNNVRDGIRRCDHLLVLPPAELAHNTIKGSRMP